MRGTQNVQQIANLLLLRGNFGKPGAGICPLRGHSNVQGDRTVGITEKPTPALIDGIERAFDEAVTTGGWLIFYTHDVADTPSPWGCTPGLLRHALEAAKTRNMPMVSVAEALRLAS